MPYFAMSFKIYLPVNKLNMLSLLCNAGKYVEMQFPTELSPRDWNII